MRSFSSLSMAMFKGFIRNKVGLFFTFLFPLMFLLVFGLLFQDSGAAKTKMVAVGGGPVLSALASTGAVDMQHTDNVDDAVKKVRDGDVPAAVIEHGDSVELRYAASDRVKAGTVLGLVSGVVDKANLAATGQPPRLTLDAQQVEASSFKAIQYITPGILSWSIATSAMFGAALTLVSWRRKQVLRRIRLSPVRPATVLFSRLLVTVGVAVLQAVLFVGIASTPAFGLKLSGQWWLASVVLVVATLAFFALGVLAGSFTKTEEAASAVANVIVLPMAFLSGTFFPIDGAPRWLQIVSDVLPLRYANDAMLDVLVRDKGIGALLVPMGVLAGFTIVVSVLAARLFKWEDA